MLGNGDQRLIPGIRLMSGDMGEKPIVWDIWASGRNETPSSVPMIHTATHSLP